tara:strand:+ start:48 stop:446 length:399 start_codon:yes stop_codon:yes gene_type:complete
MYQVSWREENTGGEELNFKFRFKLLETWAEVQSHKEWICRDGGAMCKSYAISMVLETKGEGSWNIKPIKKDELPTWFDNIVKLMPERLSGDEVAATLLNTASHYMDDDEMKDMFGILSGMIDIKQSQKKKMN